MYTSLDTSWVKSGFRVLCLSKQRPPWLIPSLVVRIARRHIASDLALRALASQAKPQRESEAQAFRIARS